MKLSELAKRLKMKTAELVALLEKDREYLLVQGVELPKRLQGNSSIAQGLASVCLDRYVSPSEGASEGGPSPLNEGPEAHQARESESSTGSPDPDSPVAAQAALALEEPMRSVAILSALAGVALKTKEIRSLLAEIKPHVSDALASTDQMDKALRTLERTGGFYQQNLTLIPGEPLGENIAREVIRSGEADAYLVVLEKFPVNEEVGTRRKAALPNAVRNTLYLRIAALRLKEQELDRIVDFYRNAEIHQFDTPSPIARVVASSFDADWVARFPPRFRALGLLHQFVYSSIYGSRFTDLIDPMYDCLESISPVTTPSTDNLLTESVAVGSVRLAQIASRTCHEDYAPFCLAIEDFVAHGPGPELAIRLVKALRKLSRCDRKYNLLERLSDLLVYVCYVIANTGDLKQRAAIISLVTGYYHNGRESAQQAILYSENARTNPKSRERFPAIVSQMDFEYIGPQSTFVWLSIGVVINHDLRLLFKETIQDLIAHCESLGLDGLLSQTLTVAKELGLPIPANAEPAQFPWHLEFKLPEAWELALQNLESLIEPLSRNDGGAVPVTRRLAWRLHVHPTGGDLDFVPLDQKMDKKGNWTRGRELSLASLTQGKTDTDWLSDLDRRILGCVTRRYLGYNEMREFELNMERALPLLVQHPLLLDPDTNLPVSVELIQPHLTVVGGDGSDYEIRLDPKPDADREYHIAEVSTGRYQVIHFNKTLRDLASTLGETGLKLPAKARERVERTVSTLAHALTIQTDVGTSIDAESRPGDCTPILQLQMRGHEVFVSLVVRPLKTGGPVLSPGSGPQHITTRLDGVLVRTQRDYDAELEQAQVLVEKCPQLLLGQDDTSRWHWTLGAEEGLEVLSAARELGDAIIIEWRSDRRLKLSGKAGVEQVQGTIKQGRDWFSLSGKLGIDEDRVVELQDLVELLLTATGRFIPIGEDRFMEVTEQLRRRAEDWRALGDSHKDGIRFHPLATQAIQDSIAGAPGIQVDKAFKKSVKKFTDAQKLEPKLPKELKAELRGYQEEGFQWMTRLAAAGLGACLADDMGLGKTVQAIAVLLDRASLGPAIVVAPTSVCPNWEIELARFAPSLSVKSLSSGDRATIVKEAGPGDVVMVSYNLLHLESEVVTSRIWATAILDEAQAIKNMATKRSQAAMSMEADFRIAMSGTPVENHLGELWNLFRFINPGLLGSHERFMERFGTPIERNSDRLAMYRLRRLTAPFLLRRTKEAVLKDLPARTEITLLVEPPAEEVAFYETLRRRAVATLSEANGAEQRFKILAQLMKLRRACCNPELVAPGGGIPSAKLAEFTRIVEELHENKHKALVFSQFVDHLSILRAKLDELGLKYQYLDGSTPVDARRDRVAAFQEGEGDFFLISLKAGGTGLNLTAADYVIHMDPWWNPAVEDQASDRAHRIGQQRPVTIYRLILKGTVEERIVSLHKEKRELADGLLEGTESVARLSVEDLLALLGE